VRIEPTELPGVVVIEPRVHRDERGFFLETYHAGRFKAAGLDVDFVQDNHSSSKQGTVRGLHLQTEDLQGKLVRCIAGAVFDVAVDVRRGSPTFARWFGVTLSAENFKQMWVPPGFAHGFAVVSERAEVEYKCTTLYRSDADLAIRWNDPAIGILWPTAAPTLSRKDATAPHLTEVVDRLPAFAG
jgi:dTDP-4-dehydrorhamnose 3,5-epimerase